MPKFNLSYHKVPNIHFKDLSFNGFQFYNPLYNELFNLDENSFNKITLNQKYQFILLMILVIKPIHIKF